ncbi:MAG TPA: hypothetical protein PLN13_11790 [Bacteroidia bacterium]|nr:hypothetical protein [Bacteroidia bacterium]HRH09256.1 hypothetical protein [Bacteroidia bacterium]
MKSNNHIDPSRPLYSLSVQEYIDLNKSIFDIQLSKLVAREQSPKSDPDEGDICFIQKASEITGYAVETIRSKCFYNEIPYIKTPGTKFLKFSKKKLHEWMESGAVNTVKEENEELNKYLISKRKSKSK